MKDQRHGWTMRKRVKWQGLQQKRDQMVNMYLREELRKLEQMMSIQLRHEKLRAAELKVEVSIGETEEEIIGDFLNYWVNLEQMDNVKPCIFVADNCDVVTGTEEDAQSCESVASVKRSLSGDKYSEDSSDDNDPLILLSDRQIIEFIAGVENQNYVLITDDEMLTTESLAGESIEDSIESFSEEMTRLWHEL